MIADRAAKIVRLRSEGKRWRQVATAMGVSYETAHRHGCRAGALSNCARQVAHHVRDQALTALSLKRQSKSYSAIAKALGVTRRHAIRLVAKAKIIDERRRKAGQL